MRGMTARPMMIRRLERKGLLILLVTLTADKMPNGMELPVEDGMKRWGIIELFRGEDVWPAGRTI